MSFVSINSADIQVGKPIKQALMQTIKDNEDWLYGNTNAVSTQVRNGSFEIDSDADGVPDGWTKGLYPGGSGGFETTSPAHGAKSYKFTHPGGAGNGGGYLTSDYVDISQYIEYVISLILWSSVAGIKNIVRIQYYDKAKASLGTVDPYSSTANPTSPAPQYLRLSGAYAPPANARYLKVILIGGYTDTAVAGTTYFDDVVIRTSVTQGMLKTSIGSVQGSGNLTLPGGEYGFYPQVKKGDGTYVSAQIALILSSTSYVTNISLQLNGGSYVYAQQRYITSSGEVHWIFILKDKSTSKTLAAWQAPDHPCFGNGGKPALVAHPFNDYDPNRHEIIVINPDGSQLQEIMNRCGSGREDEPDRDPLEVIAEDYHVNDVSQAAWPTIPITIGLSKEYQHRTVGETVSLIKKVLPKPDYIIMKSLTLRDKK